MCVLPGALSLAGDDAVMATTVLIVSAVVFVIGLALNV